MSTDDEQQTTVVPDAAPTEYVALAWSDDDDDIFCADDDDDPGYLRAFLRGFGVTLGVLLPVAATPRPLSTMASHFYCPARESDDRLMTAYHESRRAARCLRWRPCAGYSAKAVLSGL
jgi:hypothetical protein